MQQSVTTSTNLSLTEVKEHFDHWRATRTKRSKIPDSLWNEVKALIGRYPTNQIAQALGVNASQISKAVNTKSDFTFVAVHPVNLPSATNKPASTGTIDTKGTCSFEIHRSSGSILKITEFPVMSLASIINQFME